MLQEAAGFDPHELVIADIYNGNIYRYLRPTDALTSIRSTDFIFVYQVCVLDHTIARYPTYPFALTSRHPTPPRTRQKV